MDIQDFWARESGRHFTKDLWDQSRVGAQELASMLEGARYYQKCAAALPELRALQATQAKAVEKLRAELAALDAKIASKSKLSDWRRPDNALEELEFERLRLDARIDREKAILNEVDTAIRIASSVSPVICPDWLREFLK